MEYKTNKEDKQKVTNKLQKLCSLYPNMSQKDITAHAYVTEKSSRIASVTYMLARMITDEDVLKAELQKSSIGLARDVALANSGGMERALVFRHLARIITLLEVAQNTGALSKMNTALLSDDIIAFMEVLTESDWTLGRKYMDTSFFSHEVPRDIFSPEPLMTRTATHEGHMKDVFRDRELQKEERASHETNGQTEKQAQRTPPHYKERLQEVQKDRRATILGLVQRKDRITVKDVANVIKDCSEKTIQRELLALVRQGVLKKEGERRWSTYTLA